jgi:hypothetical protein
MLLSWGDTCASNPTDQSTVPPPDNIGGLNPSQRSSSSNFLLAIPQIGSDRIGLAIPQISISIPLTSMTGSRTKVLAIETANA